MMIDENIVFSFDTCNQSTMSIIHSANEDYNTTELAEVWPGLWLGGLKALKEIRKIARSWTVISVLQSAQSRDFAQDCLNEIENDSVRIEKRVMWELADRSQAELLSTRLDEILNVIDSVILTSSEEDYPRACLVHCAFGISRSASVVAAWLLSRKKVKTLEEAMEILRSVRPKVSPNMGFVAMLRALEQCDGNVVEAIERMKMKAID
jgi:protein-tyrosine phosphatase